MAGSSPFDMLNQFHLTLGQFRHTYTRLEIALAITVRQLSGVSTPIAKALFSGLGAGAATEKIRRLLIATSASDAVKKEFNDVFSHLGHITSARNTILHYGIQFKDEGLLTSNSMSALTEKQLKNIPLSIAILRQMNTDCQTIEKHLWRHMARKKGVDPQTIEEMWSGLDDAPWLYKPPASQCGQIHTKSRKRQRPLRSSRG
jgi:hypothetical protein